MRERLSTTAAVTFRAPLEEATSTFVAGSRTRRPRVRTRLDSAQRSRPVLGPAHRRRRQVPGVTATLTASVRTSRPAGTATTRAASVPLACRVRSRREIARLTRAGGLGLAGTGAVAAGAVPYPTTGPVGAEAAIAAPSALVAVTVTRRATPTSASVGR